MTKNDLTIRSLIAFVLGGALLGGPVWGQGRGKKPNTGSDGVPMQANLDDMGTYNIVSDLQGPYVDDEEGERESVYQGLHL